MTELSVAETESEPADTRSAFVGSWVRASARRAPIDSKCLTHQVNAWSLDLSRTGWVAKRYGPQAIACAGAPPGIPLRGWEGVAEMYRDFADPLARYVVSYYYETWALRPSGIPYRLRDPIREQARSTACTAVHHRLLHGSAQEDAVLVTEPIAGSFVADLAADTVKHRVAHRAAAVLAFADGVLDQARLLDRDHVAVARGGGVPIAAVAPLVARLIDTADRLIEDYGGDLPDEPAAVAAADELLAFARTEYERVAEAIRQHTLLDEDAPAALERRSQHLGEVWGRTHRALTRMIRRGSAMTEEDARRMFYGRLGWLTRRDQMRPVSRIDVADVAAPRADPGGVHDLLGQLRGHLLRDAGEIPLGLGGSAEYELTLRLLGLPRLEAEILLRDPELLSEWCAAAWAGQRPERAIAMDGTAAADLVGHLVRWAAERAGYRP
ncbi:hypothetical protein ACFXHA_32785 [Nocardia sp. NPDC059240]|uniref:hypothetical protein n=1 Tax=Nocardia sp. NPDC059240 TaxID=3346786 RepID=UPI0036B18716